MNIRDDDLADAFRRHKGPLIAMGVSVGAVFAGFLLMLASGALGFAPPVATAPATEAGPR